MLKKQNYPKFLVIILFLAIILIPLTACSKNSDATQDQVLDESPILTQEISASGEVVPVQWATLSFLSMAEDVQVLIAEGDQVSKGDRLIQNNDTQLETALLQAQSSLERAQFAYEQILNAPADVALKSAFSAFFNARINLKQQEENDASDDLIKIAQADFDAARANYDAVSAGSSEEEIKAAENDLKAAELSLEQAETAFELIAPFDGTVVEVYVKSGEAIGTLQPVLVIADLNNLQIVTTDLSEVDVTKLELGQKADIIFDAISDQTFSGRIERIADKSTGVSSVYYKVTLSVDEMPENLRWGMTAFITFPVE